MTFVAEGGILVQDTSPRLSARQDTQLELQVLISQHRNFLVFAHVWSSTLSTQGRAGSHEASLPRGPGRCSSFW